MPANLEVSKTTAAPVAPEDSSIVYTLTITNNGPPISNVIVKDFLPQDALHPGWTDPILPTLSTPGTWLSFPATIAPQATVVTLNGVPTAFTEAAGGGYTADNTATWSTAAGGFALATGDVLQIIFAVDEAADEVGTHFNSVSITHGVAPFTQWYPDLNVLSVVKRWQINKQLVAVNGVPWGGGVPNIDVGDTVTYEVILENIGGKGKEGKDNIQASSVLDTIPLGFKYLPGTSIVNSPGAAVPLINATIADPVITPATLTTAEILSYAFNTAPAKTDPNPPAIPAPHMITGASVGDKAILRFDAVAYDVVTPNSPVVGIHNNRADVTAERLEKGFVTLSVLDAPVNVLSNSHVQGAIFHNLNGNGVYDPPPTGDQPFNGVTVELQPAGGGAAIDTFTTGSDGIFDLVAPGAGSYEVVVTDTGAILTGYTNTISPVMPVVLTDVQLLTGQDYGYVVTGASGDISGTVFMDNNADGVINGADTGIDGVTVWRKTVGGIIQDAVVTAGGGLYSFSSLPAGNHVIDVDENAAPLAQLYSTPGATPADPSTVTVIAGGTSTQDFGWASGSVFSGTIFDDASNNGVFNAGEPGHGNVTMNLVDTTTSFVVQTVTSTISPVSALGTYSFNAVQPGTYRIDVTDTNNELTVYALTTANQPMVPVTSIAGTNYVNDFGYFLAPNISVVKTMTSTTLDRGEKMDNTITVTNSGGGVSGFSVADILPQTAAPTSPFVGSAGGYSASAVDFEYDQTLSITLDGVPLIAGIDYTAPFVSDIAPVWGNIALSGGSILEIHFLGRQPVGNSDTGSPNYNGVAIEYGAVPVTVDYPDLVLFSVVKDVEYRKTLVAVNGVPVMGSPTIYTGDTLTFQMIVSNTIKAKDNSVDYFSDDMPADGMGFGLNYVLGSSKLSDPSIGTILAPIGDPGIVPAPGPGISETLTWSQATGSWGADPSTVKDAYPSEVVLQFDAIVSVSMAQGNYSNASSSSVRGGKYILFDQVPFVVNAAVVGPLLTVVKSSNVSTAVPGAVIAYMVLVQNTGAGQATSVVVEDSLSTYTSLALNPFGNGTIFLFTDGANPSGLPGTAAVTYSSNNGADGFTYSPVDNGFGYDPNITDFRITLNGTMNADLVNNPSFTVQYQVQVK